MIEKLTTFINLVSPYVVKKKFFKPIHATLHFLSQTLG